MYPEYPTLPVFASATKTDPLSVLAIGPPGKFRKYGERFIADMMLDTFRIAARNFGVDSKGHQKILDNGMPEIGRAHV